METNKKKALGKGLEQLFSNTVIDFDNFESELIERAQSGGEVVELELSQIRSNPYQPRKQFSEESLTELAASIKEYGIVQPIIVKKSIQGYEVVAGERRTRAARKIGLTRIPAIIKEFSDQDMIEIALIENIQREDLNPIEEAESYATIIDLRHLTQSEFATRFGKSRSYVTNLLGLLSLPKSVKEFTSNRQISMSHARVLSKIEDETKVIELAKRIINEDLSVREVEKIAMTSNIPKKKPVNRIPAFHYNIYEDIMREKVGTKVQITKNKIEIPFDSTADLERILEILNVRIERDSD